MAIVLAEDAKGVKRKFTEKAWNMIPVDKNGSRNGWKELSQQAVTNRKLPPAAKPSTGGEAKKPGPIIEQKINNKLKESSTGGEANTEGNKGPAGSIEEFLRAAEGINTGVVKDYFDKNSIKYGKKDAPDALYYKLGEALNFDVIELQKIFS